MSRYRIETRKTTVINGIEYKAEIDKKVDIDFSKATYTIKEQNSKLCLIPDNFDFLQEVTEIFPLSEYDIGFSQNISTHRKCGVSLHLDIKNKETGKMVFLPENAVLSDKDYDHLLKIFEKKVPQYKWQTAENYIRASIEQCLGEDDIAGLFTDDAWEFFGRMVSARYKEIKNNGSVDFDWEKMRDTAKEVLEESLRRMYENV